MIIQELEASCVVTYVEAPWATHSDGKIQSTWLPHGLSWFPIIVQNLTLDFSGYFDRF